ncbi:MAG: hypothetical protein ACTHXC_11000 [Brachybacterium sp.]
MDRTDSPLHLVVEDLHASYAHEQPVSIYRYELHNPDMRVGDDELLNPS